ncbi:MAG: hypothetical protein J6Q38_03400 [Clostridia bacterium]|nr:hypothetical protein [Clostridia bacterium]
MFSNFFERIKIDTTFRIKLFLCLSFIFNTAYSVFLFVVSQTYSSKWFFVTSIYYGLLSVARIFVYLQISPQKQLVSKIKTMRACGCFLFSINLVFSTMMFILIYGNRYIKHHEIIVIALATYTFTSLTMAIINSIKNLSKNNYLHSCAKIISLISASVSIVTLTNIMLSTFGENNTLLRSIILPVLSGFVSIFIIVCAILMIRKANLDLRKLKNGKERE